MVQFMLRFCYSFVSVTLGTSLTLYVSGSSGDQDQDIPSYFEDHDSSREEEHVPTTPVSGSFQEI